MKKIIALILAVLLIATLTFIPVSAAPGETKYGNVKKISDSDINMKNADRESVWDFALPVLVNRNNQDDPDGATTTAYMLWSDTSIYVYAEILDNHIYDQGTEPVQNAWETDSFEVFIDVTNGGDHCHQFRIDRVGHPSSYPKDGDWGTEFIVGAEINTGVFEWASKTTSGAKYVTKFKIPASTLGASGFKAGDVGLHLQINDRDEGGTQTVTWPANNEASSWDAFAYGFITLIDEPAVPPPPPVEEAAPAVVEDTAQGGGEAADAEIAPVIEAAAPAPAPAPVSSPTTGNAGMIALALVMMIAALGVVVIRKKTVK